MIAWQERQAILWGPARCRSPSARRRAQTSSVRSALRVSTGARCRDMRCPWGVVHHRSLCAVVHGRSLLRGVEDGSGLPNFVTVLPAPQLRAPRLQVRISSLRYHASIPIYCSRVYCIATVSLLENFRLHNHRQPGGRCNMQASHFVYRTQPPHPLFHPRLALARPDMLVLACCGGLLTVHLSLRVRPPAAYLHFEDDCVESWT